MSVVVSFRGWTPAARYDDLPWTEVRIEEAPASTGPWTQIDVIAFDTVDDDPEEPAARSFTTELGTDAEQWYRLVFADATGDTQQPTVPIHNTIAAAPYATVAELASILKVDPIVNNDPLTRVLEAASAEIDAEIDLEDSFDVAPALVVEVCLERAVEHWQQMKSPFGILGIGGVESGPAYTGSDTWHRHANKLAPLKEQWGLA